MQSNVERINLERGCELEEQGKFELALIFYLKAAEKGCLEAQVNLGNLYDDGRGCRKDGRMAVYWYKRAVQRGSSQAAYNLASHYRQNGSIRWSNHWLRRSAEMGDEDARLEIGWDQQ